MIMASDGYLGGIVRYKMKQSVMHTLEGKSDTLIRSMVLNKDVSVETVYNWNECFTIYD